MDIKSLVDTFFETDNLKELLEQAGRMLDCPLLVVDDAFRIAASYWPNSFQDELFFGALRRGEITYEAILAISQSEQIAQGQSVRMEVQDTPYPRCFAPLISSNIHIGYLIYVDWKNELHQTPDEQLHMHIDVQRKQFVMERSESGLTDFSRDFPALTVAPMSNVEDINLRIFVDRSSIEVFGENGKYVMTNRVFPSEPYNTLTFDNVRGNYQVKSLNIYKLK